MSMKQPISVYRQLRDQQQKTNAQIYIFHGMKSGILISLRILLSVLCLPHTGAMNSYDCGVSNFPEVPVNETEPPGKVLLRTPPSDTVDWTVSGKKDRDKTLLAGYLGFRNGSDGHYELFLTKTLDMEELVALTKEKFQVIVLELKCIPRSQDGINTNYEAFVEVLPVNEYYPQFRNSPYSLNVSEKEGFGFKLIALMEDAFDLDKSLRATDISFFAIKEYLDDPKVDGKQFFRMANSRKGQIELAKKLDFEKLVQENRNPLWLNVTVQDIGRHVNWTTVTVTVLDDDDLGPEFFEKTTCEPQKAENPDMPCRVTYSALFAVNTTGRVKLIKPGLVKARDRDSLNYSIKYSLAANTKIPDAQSFLSHGEIDSSSGVLSVVKPFKKTGNYSCYINAMEISENEFSIKATFTISALKPEDMPFQSNISSPASRAPVSSPTSHTSASVTFNTTFASVSPPSNITSVSPTSNITFASPASNITSVSPTSNITSVSPTTNITSASPTSNIFFASPASNITSASPTSKITTVSPTSNITSASPTSNITSVSPTSNITSVSPTSNITSVSPTSNITSVSPTSNITSVSPTSNITSVSPTSNITSALLFPSEPIAPAAFGNVPSARNRGTGRASSIKKSKGSNNGDSTEESEKSGVLIPMLIVGGVLSVLGLGIVILFVVLRRRRRERTLSGSQPQGSQPKVESEALSKASSDSQSDTQSIATSDGMPSSQGTSANNSPTASISEQSTTFSKPATSEDRTSVSVESKPATSEDMSTVSEVTMR